MANELTITKERVLEAASKCSQAKETLKTLFPEVFASGDGFNLYELSPHHDTNIFTEEQASKAGFGNRNFIQVCQDIDPAYRGRAFWLPDIFKWDLVQPKGRSNSGLLLVPTRHF